MSQESKAICSLLQIIRDPGPDPGPGHTPNITKSHQITPETKSNTKPPEITNQESTLHTKRGNYTQSQIITNCHYKQKKITPNTHSRNHKSGIGTSLKKGADEDLREK